MGEGEIVIDETETETDDFGAFCVWDDYICFTFEKPPREGKGDGGSEPTDDAGPRPHVYRRIKLCQRFDAGDEIASADGGDHRLIIHFHDRTGRRELAVPYDLYDRPAALVQLLRRHNLRVEPNAVVYKLIGEPAVKKHDLIARYFARLEPSRRNSGRSSASGWARSVSPVAL